MLVLGVTVLVGFEFREVFEPGFVHFSALDRRLSLLNVAALLLTLVLLLYPAARHSLVEKHQDTPEFQNSTQRTIWWALLPFSIALGLDLRIVSERVGGVHVGWLLGGLTTAIAWSFWYGLEALARRRRSHPRSEEQMEQTEQTPLEQKVIQVLTETRVVLPGAQAFLGFQLVMVVFDSFEQLQPGARWLHLSSLLCVTFSIILLMTPAAFHRIVENGEITERFHRFASRMLLAAMAWLALGICSDLVLVVWWVEHSLTWAVLAGVVALALFLGSWFGLTLKLRTQRWQST